MHKLTKKTKMVCTIGPASENKETLKNLIKSGMNVMRLNTSHGDIEEHQKRIDTIMELRKELSLPISIMLDTKGPEIRTHNFENGNAKFKKFDLVKINSSKEIQGTNKEFSISYKSLPETVKIGSVIMFDDGKLTTVVKEILNDGVIVEIQNDYKLSNKKACNIPGSDLILPFVSDHDKKFLEWGVNAGIDFIAASFVNSKNNVEEIRKILVEHNKEHIQIMSKIESRISIKNLDEIIEASDAIMIARGDLGVEVPYYDVPELQRIITEKTRAAGKVVVTATQMLDSMTDNPMPTRAEVTDVTFAVAKGTDSTMLSGESANGKFPVRTVEVMAKIAETTERNFDFISATKNAIAFVKTSNAEKAAEVANQANNGVANYVIALSKEGRMISALSVFRPNAFIIGVTTNSKIIHKFGPAYGVYMNYVETFDNLFENDAKLSEIAKNWGAENGDQVIVTLPKETRVFKVS